MSPGLVLPAAEAEPLGVLCPVENPALATPGFWLHPCRTAEWMRVMFAGPAALRGGPSSPESPLPSVYLLAWLAVAGRCLGLPIPAPFFAAVTRACSFR